VSASAAPAERTGNAYSRHSGGETELAKLKADAGGERCYVIASKALLYRAGGKGISCAKLHEGCRCWFVVAGSP
jgi:uncharacterized membrane protein